MSEAVRAMRELFGKDVQTDYAMIRVIAAVVRRGAHHLFLRLFLMP